MRKLILCLALVFVFLNPLEVKEVQAATIGAEWQAHTNTVGLWNAPLVAFAGDSITAGFGIYDTDDTAFTAPSGDRNGDIARVVEVLSGNTMMATNFGIPGAGVGSIAATATNVALLKRPKYMIVQAGVNDVALPVTFASVKVYWDNIRVATMRSNVTLIVQTIFPCAPLYADAAAITNYNVDLLAWCVSSNVSAIDANWYMRDPADRTKLIDALQSDLTHLNTNGIARWGGLCFGKLNEQGGRSATYTAWDSTENGRDAAIGVSTNGDVVTLPAGNVSWSNTVTLTKAIHLSGAGTNTLFPTNSYSGTALFQVTLVAGYTTRFSGMYFQRGGASTIFRVIGDDNWLSTLRVDHCYFATNAGSVLELHNVMGVFDHNIMMGVSSAGNTLAHIKTAEYKGLASGNGTWTNATPLFGSSNFFFFEYNELKGPVVDSRISLIDAQAGGRYVFRNNTVLRGYVEGHGSEAQYERSTHAVEIYNNTFDLQDTANFITYFRGGNGLVYSNAISNVQGAAGCISLVNNRMADNIFLPFGGADGRNPWDVNDAGSPFTTGTAASSTLHNVTKTAAGWTTNQWVGYTVRATSGKTVTSVSRSTSTLTVSCTGHGFVTGDLVSLFGANEYSYNNRYIITVSDANTFTCDIGEARPNSPATGTIKARKGLWFSEITANTSDTLTFKASVYEGENSLGVCGGQCYTNVSLLLFAGDTFEINKVTHAMDQIGRVGGSLVPSTATPTIPGAWNDQTTSPWYQWGNNLGSQTGVVFGKSSGVIVEDVHFVNNTAKPGYTRFTYPHFLVGEGDGGESFTPGLSGGDATRKQKRPIRNGLRR